MPEVLVDVRPLQGSEPGRVLELLRQGRAALPEATFTGLVDTERPELPETARACLDAVHPNAYLAALRRPDCFVQLAPDDDDPLFAARLLLSPRLPALRLRATSPDRYDRPAPLDADLHAAVARYWRARFHPVPEAELWDRVAAGSRDAPDRAGRLAAVALDSDDSLAAALRGTADLFTASGGARPLSRLLQSPRYDRVLFVLRNTPQCGALLRLLRRFGGAAFIGDACLLAAYAHDRARALRLATTELGRSPSPAEWDRWREGAPPPVSLFGEVLQAADPVLVGSAALADEIRARYGRDATVVAAPSLRSPVPSPDPLSVEAHASGVNGDGCVWALEWLRFWGVQARLFLLCDPNERPHLLGLARKLGVADALRFDPAPAPALRLFLATRGHGSRSAVMAAFAGAGPCLASRSVLGGLDPPPCVEEVPDQPSPPLLAERIRAALHRPAPDPATLDAYRRDHAAPITAARVAAALGLAT